MEAASVDDHDDVLETTSSTKSHSVPRHTEVLPADDQGTTNTNNSHTSVENEAQSGGILSSLWTKMSEYVELKSMDTNNTGSSTDSGRFSASERELFDSGEYNLSTTTNTITSETESSSSKLSNNRRSSRGGSKQESQRNGHRNSILQSGWNYFFGGSSSQSDSKQSKSKPPSRKNSAHSSPRLNRPRSASYSSPPPSASGHAKLVQSLSIPTAAETEFAANGTNTWLEWNPLDEDESDDSDDLSLVASEEEEEEEEQNQGTGEGHNFSSVFLNFTWCDQCGGVIWGFRQCLRCSCACTGSLNGTRTGALLYWNPVWRDCKYTCHYKCLNEVRLDCTESPIFKEARASESPQHTLVSIKDGVDDTSSLTGLSREELMWRIEDFNRKEELHPIKLESDSQIFVGSIRIFMNLSRPISIPSGSPLPKACSTLHPYDHSVDHSKRRTSFFLPKNTYEDIQIASESTALQVIQGILSHIQVIDNCRKFALFERTDENGEVLMRKLADDDKPLLLKLLWGGDCTTKRYDLRENETGQIEWEAFSLPELHNFLRILDKEEQEHVEQVQNKYLVYEKHLQDAMAYID